MHKADSTTTKLRVVFDGSAKTESGASLNDNLLVGPKIQDDLFNILNRFRFHRIALSADVAKMYRQVELDVPDRDYHRILWRNNNSEPLQHLRMTRVTYGIASWAFHSVRTLHKIGDRESDVTTRQIIKRDFYVDDLISGASTIEEASLIQDNLIDDLRKGGFELRKWSSNKIQLVQRLSPDLRETKEILKFDDDESSIKALGIRWHPASE